MAAVIDEHAEQQIADGNQAKGNRRQAQSEPTNQDEVQRV
jgi:hypothetical protein